MRRQHQRRARPGRPRRPRPLHPRRQQRRHQPVHVRHRGPRPHQRGRRGPRARPPDHRQLLAAVPGPDLRAHRPRAAAGRERGGLRQPARGLQLHPQGPARARPGEGPQDPRGRDRPRAAPERPAPPAHVPHALGARGRRRHRRHDRRRGARRERHRRAPGRAPAEPGRLHGAPQQDLPDRGLRHVLPGAAPHEHRARGPRPRPHPHRGGRDHRPARRVPRQAAPQAALRQRGLRGLRRVRAGLPGPLPQRLRLRRERAQGDRPPVRQRRAQHVRDREEGLEPVQERLRRAHLRAGLRRAGRRGPLRGRLPRRQRAQPVQQRLRPHLHAPLRDRLRARQGRRARRHRRAQAVRRGRPWARPCRCSRRRSSTRSAWRSSAPAPPASPAPATWPTSATRSRCSRPSRSPAACSAPASPTTACRTTSSSARSTRCSPRASSSSWASAPAPTSPSTASSSRATRPSTWPPACRRAPRRRCPGDDLEGVTRAVELLRELNLGGTPQVGDKVVVIGGGDVALDAARSAIRLQQQAGKEPDVTLVYRRTKVEMPANVERGRGGPRGGPQGRVPRAAARHRRRGRQGRRRSSCSAASSASPDESGRRQPVAVEGWEFELAGRHGRLRRRPGARRRLRAGLRRPGAREGPDLRRPRDDDDDPRGRLRRRRRRGPRLLHGHRGRGGRPQRRRLHPQLPARRAPAARCGTTSARSPGRPTRSSPPSQSASACRWPWSTASSAAATGARSATATRAEEAVAEAERCLNCAVCSECDSCVRACPSGAIDWDQTETIEDITVGAVIIATGHQEFDARRKRHARLRPLRQRHDAEPAGPTARRGRPHGRRARAAVRQGRAARTSSCSSASARATAQSSGNEHCSAICCLFATLHAPSSSSTTRTPRSPSATPTCARPGKAHEEYYQPRAVARRALRARPRQRDHRGAGQEPARALRGHAHRTQERGALRPRRALGRPGGERGHRRHRPRGRPADRRGGLHQGVPPQAGAGGHAAHRHVRGRHGAGAQEHPRLDRPGEGRGGPRHQHAQHGLRAHAGAGRGERPGRVHRLRRLRDGLPAGRRARSPPAPTRTARSTPTSAAAAASATRSAPPEPSSSAASATTRSWRRRRSDGGAGNQRQRTVVAFCCRECAYAAADASANARTPLPPDGAARAHAVHRARQPAAHPERARRGRRRRHGRRLPRGPVPLPRGQLQRHRPGQVRAAPAQERRRRARARAHVHHERRRAAQVHRRRQGDGPRRSAACRRWSGPPRRRRRADLAAATRGAA